VSRGEGELLTVPKPRAVRLLSVCPAVKPVGEPDALVGHVRFDERGWETERCRMAQVTAPILDSTIPPQGRDLGALRRIAEGTYGICAQCGADIDPKRLEALPIATRCILCAA
jgi:Prokaryotic dksA/traR C4-type zinc finger